MKSLSFFLIMSAFLMAGNLTTTLAEPTQTEIELYRKRQKDATPQSVLNWLMEGNERFAEGRSIHGGFPINVTKRRKIIALSQRPLAVVLSCIDSRTTPEAVFDTSIGDLFTTRVGANVINDDVLGSLEISVASGVRVVMVLGHTDCGGVKAACNDVHFEHMTQLFKRIKPAIEKANVALDADPFLSNEIGERKTSNRKYVAHVSHFNVKQSVEQVLKRSTYLRKQVEQGTVLVIPALYNVDTGRVLKDI